MSSSTTEISTLILNAANASDNYVGSITQEINNILRIFNEMAALGPSTEQSSKARAQELACYNQYQIAKENARLARNYHDTLNRQNALTAAEARQLYQSAQTACNRAQIAYEAAVAARKNVQELHKELLLKPSYNNLEQILKMFNEMAPLKPTQQESEQAREAEIRCRTLIWKGLNEELPYSSANTSSNEALGDVSKIQNSITQRIKREKELEKWEEDRRRERRSDRNNWHETGNSR